MANIDDVSLFFYYFSTTIHTLFFKGSSGNQNMLCFEKCMNSSDSYTMPQIL